MNLIGRTNACGGGADTSIVTAGAGDILSGKVIVDANGNPLTGTMANRGAVSQTLDAEEVYTIPEGYHNGSGKVTSNAKKSLVLPTNPDISIKSDDAKLTLSWTQPDSEVEIDHYNIYTSLSEPSSLKDMDLVGSVIAKESVPITFKSSIDNYSKDGLSISKISDGKYSVVSDGSGSGGISIVCGNFIKENGKTYKLYGCPSGGSSTTYCLHTPDNSTNYDDFGNGVSFVSSEDVNNAYLFFSLYLNVEYDVIFEPKIDKINNSFTLTNLTNDQTYYVGIQSVTADGYENASIWKVKNGTPIQFIWVTVGSSGNSAYSTDGETWIGTTYNYGSLDARAVCYGNEKFVLVGNGGVSQYSYDGITWNGNATTSSTMDGNGKVAICYGKDRFVCVGTSGKSYYSLDGENWVAMSGLPNNYSFRGVCYGNGIFVVVGDTYIYYSENGTRWKVISGIGAGLISVCYANGRFVAVGNNGNSYYSLDGENWVSMSGLNSTINFSAIAYGNGRFVTMANNGWSYQSTDGATWKQMDTGLVAKSMTYAKNRFICVGTDGNSNRGIIGYLLDGSTDWVEEMFTDVTCYNGVCSNAS